MGHRRISTASTHTLRVSTLWHRLGLHLPRPEVNVGLAHPSWHASASCGAVRRSRYSWQSGAARLAPDSTRGLLQLSGVRPAENAHSRRDVDRGVSTPSPFSARKSLVHPPRAGLPEEDRSRQAARREQEALNRGREQSASHLDPGSAGECLCRTLAEHRAQGMPGLDAYLWSQAPGEGAR